MKGFSLPSEGGGLNFRVKFPGGVRVRAKFLRRGQG